MYIDVLLIFYKNILKLEVIFKKSMKYKIVLKVACLNYPI